MKLTRNALRRAALALALPPLLAACTHGEGADVLSGERDELPRPGMGRVGQHLGRT